MEQAIDYLPGKMRQAMGRVGQVQDVAAALQQLQREPMFCMETAVRLYYWSRLVRWWWGGCTLVSLAWCMRPWFACWPACWLPSRSCLCSAAQAYRSAHAVDDKYINAAAAMRLLGLDRW